MDAQKQNEAISFIGLIGKSMTVIVAIAFGLFGKLSLDISMGRKLSFWSWLGIFGLSVFVGYMSSVICSYYHLDNASKIIVPIATLFGEKIVEFTMLKFGAIAKAWALDNLDSIKKFMVDSKSDTTTKQ